MSAANSIISALAVAALGFGAFVMPKHKPAVITIDQASAGKPEPKAESLTRVERETRELLKQTQEIKAVIKATKEPK